MIYLIIAVNLIHAWLCFLAPTTVFSVNTSIKQQAVFTIIYASGVLGFRAVLPPGIHTLLLIPLSIILFRIILKEKWLQAIKFTILTVLVLLITDALLNVPLAKYFGITLETINTNTVYIMITAITSNLGLILLTVIFKLRNRKTEKIYY